MSKRHVHQWIELLKRGGYERTTFVFCTKCHAANVESVRYLDQRATAEFRWQVKHGYKPHLVRDGLVPVRRQA